MKLSILDFGYVPPGCAGSEVLREIVQLAPLVESLGYSRLWLAGHHESHFAYACPEILTCAVAAATTHIRVGVAGMLMHFHSPLRIAESFRMLEALHPGRIDLGAASGLTGSRMIQEALRHGFDPQEAAKTRLYTKQVEELIAYCRNEIPAQGPAYRGATPIGQQSPPLFLLGGGRGIGNMTMAARYGTSFCYSLSHGPSDKGPQIVARYREEFRPSSQLQKPHVMVAATLLCMETDADAVGMLRGFRYKQPLMQATVLGNPRRCRDRIAALLEKYQCDEFVAIPMYDTIAARARGYELLADVCGLGKCAREARSSGN